MTVEHPGSSGILRKRTGDLYLEKCIWSTKREEFLTMLQQTFQSFL